jgi:Domain of unknown function (DUF4407)
MGAEISLFSASIAKELNKFRFEQNTQIVQQYGVRIDDLLQQKLGPLETDRRRPLKIIDEDAQVMEAAQRKAAVAAERLATAEANMIKESKGTDGRTGGKGRAYWLSETSAEAARADVVDANSAITTYGPQLDAATKQLKETTPAYNQARADLQPQITALEKERDSYLDPTVTTSS